MSCVKCIKPPQSPYTLDCDDVYCFLCLKDQITNGDNVCARQGCQQLINVDLTNVSEDFRSTLLGLIGKSVWLYSSISSDGWWLFNPHTINTIEQCYTSGVPTCSFMIGTKTYNINFVNGVQNLVTVALPGGGGGGGNVKQRSVKRITFTQSKVDEINIKGIAGMYFKTIEDQIGKFV